MAIVGGAVTIEDGRKEGGPNDFVPTRKVKVELSFVVEEGTVAQSLLDRVGELANDKVDELLGSRTRGRTEKFEPKDGDILIQRALPPTVKEQLQESLKIESPTAAPPTTAKATSTDPLEIPEALNRKSAKRSAKTTPAPAESTGTTAPQTTAPSAQISDADLYKATSMTQDAVKKPAEISALIRKHTANLPAEQQRLAFIPQPARAAYLADLELLKAMG